MSEAGTGSRPRWLARSRSRPSRPRTTRRSTPRCGAWRRRRGAALVGPRVLRLAAHGGRAAGRLERLRRSSSSSRATGPSTRRCRRAGLTGKSPGLMALVSGWLPPTQYSLRFEDRGIHVKAAVLRYDTYRRETSARRRDHFCIGRLFQPTRLLHARDEAARQGTPGRAGRGAPRDVGLVAALAARALRRRGLRPLGPADLDAVGSPAGARRAGRRPVGGAAGPPAAGLRGAARGARRPRGARAPPGARRRDLARRRGRWAPRSALRLELYFRRSIVRATARWLKHIVTFEGWLDYIVRKASRHTGRADRAHRTRAPVAPRLPLGPPLPLPSDQEPQGEPFMSPTLLVLAAVLGAALVSMPVFALVHRGRATPTPRRRARASSWGSATSSCTGSCGRSGRWSGRSCAWARAPTT